MWKSIFSAFLLVFLAELGDKTQLSTIMLSAKSHSIWYTFIGSALALVLSSFLGAISGSFIHKYIPSFYIQLCSGIAFVIIGIMLISGKL